MLGKLVDLLLLERADHQCGEKARKDKSRVAVRLASRKLELARGEEERNPTESCYPGH